MEEVNLCSPREIKKILNNFCLHPRKKWGQNFLIDGNIVDKILNEVDLSENDYIIEVGPGLGTLTLPMIKKNAFVSAFEIDRGLVAFLKELLAPYDNKLIFEGDIRKIDLNTFSENLPKEQCQKVKIVANLPYYISSPFIYNIISGSIFWDKAVLMVQKEVAQRIIAKEGDPLYGTLSVLCRHFTHTRIAFNVPSSVFFPSPRVESAVIVSEPLNSMTDTQEKKTFIELVSGIFRYRRKTILNSLCNSFSGERSYYLEILSEAGIDPGSRPENLSGEEFANLNRLIYNSDSK